MIDHIDFLPMYPLGNSKRCSSSGCKNKPKDVQFYLTEWTLLGGNSTQFGVYYCEECILKHNPDIKQVRTIMKKLEANVFKPMFNVGDLIKHVKTGNVYIVIAQPNKSHILEYCNLPFYAYTEQVGLNPKTWYRAQTVMEDGRFIKK